VNRHTSPEIFCPAGGRPYKYRLDTLNLGQGQQFNATLPLGAGYVEGEGDVIESLRNDAFIQVVNVSCEDGFQDCSPGYDCRCYGDLGDTVRDCVDHVLCSFHGTFWENRNPRMRPSCMCQDVFTGPRCEIEIDSTVKCDLASQESTLTNEAFYVHSSNFG
jgi:hypothetical protein